MKAHQLGETFRETAEAYFTPIAQQLVEQKNQQDMPLLVGVNGCQGSGKSTLSAYIADYITEYTDLTVAVLSLDDFYYGSDQRLLLADTVHPLLKTRGVPGTHNIPHLSQVLSDLKAQKTGVDIPRFNKATDNPHPIEQWTRTEKPIDIVLMEGWCWGVLPEEAGALLEPINGLEATSDKTMNWRTYVNQQLTENYVSLYAQMQQWIFLQAPSFDSVFNWRLEQEEKLQASSQAGAISTNSSNKVMNKSEVHKFIQHYQRLTQQSLKMMPDYAHFTLCLNAQRKITQLIKNTTVKTYA